MQVHPDISALRGDASSQRRIAGRMKRASQSWAKTLEHSCVQRALAEFGAGADLADCGALASLMADHDAASRLVGGWVDGQITALRDEPLGEVAHPHRSNSPLATVQLAVSGRATLNLVVFEPDMTAERHKDAPASAQLIDRKTTELVLAGSGCAVVHSLDVAGAGHAKLASLDLDLEAGQTLALSGADQARQIVSVERTITMLQLMRSPARPKPTREIRLSDGAIARMISGDKSASHRFMALGVLGAIGHKQGADVMQQRALDRCEDRDVRWEAVRQLLALDSRMGWALLEKLIARENDSLSEPAASLRATLLQSRPELAQIMETV